MNNKTRQFIIVTKNIINKITSDDLLGYAASSCFYITLSFFPFLIVLLGLFHLIPLNSNEMFNMLKQVTPYSIESNIGYIIDDLYNNYSYTLTIFTALLAIWSAGRSFTKIIECIDNIYEAPVQRGWLIHRIISTIYTLFFMLALILTLMTLVLGKYIVLAIMAFSPAIAAILAALLSNKHIFIPLILIMFFDVLYINVPKRKTTFIRQMPGAIFASAGWCIFSVIFSFYLEHSSNFSYLYGSLASLVFILLWLYFCMVILFLGAELNILIEKNFYRA